MTDVMRSISLTGDGAGILVAMPHAFMKDVARDEFHAELPAPGKYACGFVFLSKVCARLPPVSALTLSEESNSWSQYEGSVPKWCPHGDICIYICIYRSCYCCAG